MVDLARFLLLVLPVALLAETNLDNLGAPVNTADNEFAPSLTADGQTMVFNAKRGARFQDIYITHRKNGRWGKPQNLGVLNSRYNDETPFISHDGQIILFSSDRDGSIEMPKDSRGHIRVSFDLYWSQKKGNAWSRPRKIPGPVNTANHERTPSLSKDGKVLFYSTWPFGNIKGAKLMMAQATRQGFGEATPLPASINSGHQEAGFTPARDRKGFYFSSRRPGGFGGWDIYFVSHENGKFGVPANLGKPVNSAENDMYLSSVRGQLFLCSNRKGGVGKYDIYGLISKVEWRLKIVDKKTGQPLMADGRLTTAGGKGERLLKGRSDSQGLARFELEGDEFIGRVSVSKEGYLPYLKEKPKHNDGEVVVQLQQLEKQASFEIHAIRFDFDSARIKKESRPYLDELVAYLQKNRSLNFLITGHTDLKGSASYNMKLSLRRARAVRDYLVNKGLASKRFKVKGAGESRPLVKRTGAPHDAKNRRTEFTLID